jgi:hypothetical protein
MFIFSVKEAMKFHGKDGAPYALVIAFLDDWIHAIARSPFHIISLW